MGFMKERKGFKVGDRVEVSDNYSVKAFHGMTGTVYQIDDDCCLYIDVILDGFTEGHNGHAGDRSTNHRYFDAEELKVLTSTRHKVGDLVQVRSYLSTEKSYGGIYPSEQMLHKVGQKVRIKAVTKTGRYKIEGSCFTWTNEMFEEVKKETPVETKTEKTTRFKVGDKVKVRNDLKVDSRYLMDDSNVGDTFVSEMSEFKGETVTISEITASGKYLVEEDETNWNWTDDMFEDKKVEPTKNREPKVGDRIRMTQNFCEAKVGMTGVIKFKRELDFAVEFDDEFVGGHSCCGRVKSHRGHYVQAIHFEVTDTQKHSIATVTFDNDKEYCYLCDVSVKKGDKVVVPCGSCDRETIATVVKTGEYTEENAPYPIDKMKKVIRKGTDTKPTSENDFDWYKFKDNKIIVHCRTQKSWDNFLEECEKRDIKWNSYDRATYGSGYWLNHKDQSSIVKGLRGAHGMTHASLELHREEMPTAAVYDWTSKKYVDKPVEEKEVEDKHTYKVDDKVEIRNDLVVGKNYGGLTWLSGMEDQLSGKIFTIKDVILGNYRLDDGTSLGYIVSTEMIKGKATKTTDEKPIPKIEVGDVVRAIDNYYGITTLQNEWEGVVISVSNGEFNAITTNHKRLDYYKYDRYWGLDPKHFEIIKKNT